VDAFGFLNSKEYIPDCFQNKTITMLFHTQNKSAASIIYTGKIEFES
jgi:hypothetical protein